VVLSFAVAVASAQFLGLDERVYQYIEEKYDRPARERVENWQSLMQETNLQPQLTDAEKTRAANDFFNQVRWISDLEHWQVEDYWATPIETLATNGGDCEDFSIGKYFTLNETGVDNEKIRITYVKALEYNQAHMVLAYYPSPDAEPLILDNINKTILPASQRTDLLPIYSFNGEGLWLAKARGRKLKGNSQQSLPQWRQVNERMLKELEVRQTPEAEVQ
jgi:predicted transglutaminase-like cysteine proteinase